MNAGGDGGMFRSLIASQRSGIGGDDLVRRPSKVWGTLMKPFAWSV